MDFITIKIKSVFKFSTNKKKMEWKDRNRCKSSCITCFFIVSFWTTSSTVSSGTLSFSYFVDVLQYLDGNFKVNFVWFKSNFLSEKLKCLESVIFNVTQIFLGIFFQFVIIHSPFLVKLCSVEGIQITLFGWMHFPKTSTHKLPQTTPLKRL